MSRRFAAIASATPRSSDSMPGIRGWCIDEHDDRPTELFGQPHHAQRLPIPFGPGVSEVPEDLLLRVRALHVADHEHRLIVELGEAGHHRVVVGEAAIAVDLDESREEALDEALEAGPPGMTRHLHALPRRQHGVEVGAHRLEPPAQRRQLPVAGLGRRQRLERLDLLQQNGDRLLEVEGFRRHRSWRSRHRREIACSSERRVAGSSSETLPGRPPAPLPQSGSATA